MSKVGTGEGTSPALEAESSGSEEFVEAREDSPEDDTGRQGFH